MPRTRLRRIAPEATGTPHNPIACSYDSTSENIPVLGAAALLCPATATGQGGSSSRLGVSVETTAARERSAAGFGLGCGRGSCFIAVAATDVLSLAQTAPRTIERRLFVRERDHRPVRRAPYDAAASAAIKHVFDAIGAEPRGRTTRLARGGVKDQFDVVRRPLDAEPFFTLLGRRGSVHRVRDAAYAVGVDPLASSTQPSGTDAVKRHHDVLVEDDDVADAQGDDQIERQLSRKEYCRLTPPVVPSHARAYSPQTALLVKCLVDLADWWPTV